jgi:hypothetical protein
MDTIEVGREKVIVADEQSRNPLEDFAAELSESLPGQSVEIKNSSVDQVDGGQVKMHQSFARSLKASALNMEESAAGFARAGSVDVADSAIGFLAAADVSLDDVNASVVAAKRVDAQNVRAFAIFAAELDGDAKSVLTPATALAAGAGFALSLFVIRSMVSALFSRRRRQADA